VTIGRAPDNSIVLTSDALSRYHARIVRHLNEVFLEDLSSVNGTSINDHRVIGKQQLGPNDRIQIGPYVVTVERK
jgi:pilus assembly protein CpaF